MSGCQSRVILSVALNITLLGFVSNMTYIPHSAKTDTIIEPERDDNNSLTVLHGKMDLQLHVVSMHESECINLTVSKLSWAPYLLVREKNNLCRCVNVC